MITSLLAVANLLAQTALNAPPVEPDKPPMFTASFIVSMIIIFVAFYFLITKPQKEKEAEVKKKVEGMKKGDKVVSIGGIHGTVVRTTNDTIHVMVAKDVEMVFNKTAVNLKPKEEKKKDEEKK